MTHESWQIVQYTALAIAAVMELFEIANNKNKFHFWWKTIMICLIVLGATCAIMDTQKMALDAKIKETKDSLKQANDCIKASDNVVNHFNSQREFISGQLMQLGFKIDKTNNRILKINEKMLPDSAFKKLDEFNKSKHKYLILE